MRMSRLPKAMEKNLRPNFTQMRNGANITGLEAIAANPPGSDPDIFQILGTQRKMYAGFRPELRVVDYATAGA